MPHPTHLQPPANTGMQLVFPNVRAATEFMRVTAAQTGSLMGAPTAGLPTSYQGNRKPRVSMTASGQILIAGADAGSVYFGPMQPLQPIAQYPEAQVIGRRLDYPVGYNTRTTPRGQELVGFSKLRALASYDVIRIMIERVKDKIVTKPWAILPKDKKKKRDTRCDIIEDFLQMPDKEHTWQDWARQLMDQLIVYDAPAIYLRNDAVGRLYSMEIQNGALFTPKIMANGRTPPWNMGPAYQMVLKQGLPAVDYIKPVPTGEIVPRDPDGELMPELLYKPRNPRVDAFYGYGPIEQMIISIEIGLGRERYLGEYYTSGSTPDLIFTCPKEWTSDQIIAFKVWWDSVLAGNLANRRGTMFVPDGATPIDTKEKALTDQTDEWLVRLFCFSMGLSPMPFIKMMNRASGEQHNTESNEEGQMPWQAYFTDMFNLLIPLKWGWKDLCFRWEEEEETDPTAQADIDVKLVNAKIYHPDEIRAQRGDEAMTDDMRGQMDLATFNAAVNSTVLPDDQQQAENDHALAMQEAKPAPVVASGGDAKKWEQFMALLEKRDAPAPVHINVEGPVINPAKVEVHPAAVTVNNTNPEIKLGDTFVEVGATNVKVDKQSAVTGAVRTYETSRGPNGELVGKIHDTVTRNVTASKGADGKIVAKVSE